MGDRTNGTDQKILDMAVGRFADFGYSGVSMRDIARAVGVTPAALYHHFPDKESLYLAAIKLLFENRAKSLAYVLESKLDVNERFRTFITSLYAGLNENNDFRRIFIRELLEGDESRLELLAKEVFVEMYESVREMLIELAPKRDPHLTTLSIAGAVIYHIETNELSRFLPGAQPEHEDVDVVANHIADLFLEGMK